MIQYFAAKGSVTMEILAINVIKLRKWAGITQAQLADSLGIGVTTVNNIETGYLTAPSSKIIEKMAILFDTTIDGIMGRTPLDIRERARLIYVVSSLSAKTSLVENNKIVDGIFIDRDKLRGYEWFGIKIADNALSGIGIMKGYTAIVKVDANVKNNDIVVAAVNDCEDAVVRVYHKVGSIITLEAKNDSGFYKNITIDTEKDSFKLIGKVEKCEFEL